MRIGAASIIALSVLKSFPAPAAEQNVRVELNTLESTESQCRMTFVIENKSAALESLKLDLVVFNTESVVYRRLITEMGPVRAGRTIVKTFAIDTKCAQVGAVLVNDVSACVPGEPNSCLDGLALSSRVKNVRLYK
ncbi:MAG: hypothetical protein GEU95_18680 [Rhizobiales bacterium]|nr:hypothetical protein [Hyphomicrobiales bacterium]